jgi:hypothetical protein
MTQKSWKTVVYIIDFKNGSRCFFFFFSEKGAVSNFFFEKGEVGQKRLGTCDLDCTALIIDECGAVGKMVWGN